ncbi:hypothetical protein LY78DRAFT_683393 [Colletotrichum sublineola]|nr:hypothetical protein LY78DRAFT_683393 [Colletotrichum sublineola]
MKFCFPHLQGNRANIQAISSIQRLNLVALPSTTRTIMQFASFLLTALLAAAASATPIANAEAPATFGGEKLTARQYWCTECKNGRQTCCTATQCSSNYPC